MTILRSLGDGRGTSPRALTAAAAPGWAPRHRRLSCPDTTFRRRFRFSSPRAIRG